MKGTILSHIEIKLQCYNTQISKSTLLFLVGRSSRQITITKPMPWSHTESINRDQLNKMRDEFWDTTPFYGGKRGNFHL